MADVAATPPKAAKVAKVAKVTKKKTPPAHPPVAHMVTEAVKTLKDRKGSSLPAIKKYMGANYKVDVVKLAPFIKKFIRGAVVSNKLVQVKGTGAAGSFKLPVATKGEPKKKPATKKTVTKTKSPAKAKKPAPKTKSPTKAKKSAKSPAKSKKTAPKKTAVKKPASKKPAAKSPAAKRPAAKKSAAKKPAKKPAAKK